MLRWAKQAQRLTCLRDLLPATLQATLQGVATPGLSSYDEGRCFGSSAAPFVEFVALNNLSDNPGATRTGKRLGRGIGSGKGKTSGRGHKGQKARTGRKVKIGFEGGQNPIKRYTPKRGFHNPFAVDYTPLNLYRLRDCIDSGRLSSEGVITMKDLRDTGTIQRRVRDGVKLLGGGAPNFDKKVHLQVSSASSAAREAVEKAGGTVTTVYYNKLGLRALLMPEWFDKKQRLLPRAAQPHPKKKDRFDVTGSLPANTVLPPNRELPDLVSA